jgi:hypothetical protein
MVACRWNNQQESQRIDIYGIVSNGQAWQFYKPALAREVLETELYGTEYIPAVLGALDYVCGECAKNIP